MTILAASDIKVITSKKTVLQSSKKTKGQQVNCSTNLFSVYLFIVVVFHFIRDRDAGAADSVEINRRPSPQPPPPGPPEGAQGVPRPAEKHSPSVMSWAIPWASFWWDMPGTPPEGGVQEASGIDARATSTESS
ncbi:hypothetical protein CHARACLAT_030585 [Characodon lateralis]|uniref:Uncharacterized protein n=1 Tax=Characodon lateralis TaxID=208331 RepID=A0ABU7DL68_9TELE|nr:hypothetical protein [Characodon lateralis]